MPRRIAYFFTMASPWAYLGHDALMALSARHGCRVEFRPMPVRGVFDATGGLPLPRRHPARQRYRLVELQRWRERRGLPLELSPRHSPFDAGLADRVVIALQDRGEDPDGFMRAAFRGIRAESRDLADEGTLREFLSAAGHDAPAVLADARGEGAAAAYEAHREAAIALDVFGAPSYVLDGEVF